MFSYYDNRDTSTESWNEWQDLRKHTPITLFCRCQSWPNDSIVLISIIIYHLITLCQIPNYLLTDYLVSPVLTEKHESSDATSQVSTSPTILPIAVELLKDFDLFKWKQHIRRAWNVSRTDYQWPPSPGAEHLLWLQVYLLDREIQHVMQSLSTAVKFKGPLLPSYNSFDPTEDDRAQAFSSKIINAVDLAWSDADDLSAHEPLIALERKIAIELGVYLCHDDTSSYISQLADLLRLRCVFYAAYLMAIPDSSEYMRYINDPNSHITLPMI